MMYKVSIPKLVSNSDIQVKAKSAHEPSGPHCWSLCQFPWHEATRSIATPAGWDATCSSLQVTPVFHQVSLTVCRYPFYAPGWREVQL